MTYDGPLCLRGWCADLFTSPRWARLAFGSPRFGIATDQNGAVLRWDGTRFAQEPAPLIRNIQAVWASATTAWVVGDGVAAFDGQTWRTLPVAGSFYAVHGTGPDDVWLVGSRGAIAHWDGTSLRSMNSGVTETLYAVVAQSPALVTAVGAGGTVLRYQGLGWTRLTSGITASLWAATAEGTSVVAVGSRLTVRISASGVVSPLPSHPFLSAHSVVSTSMGVWVSGNDQVALLSGSAWVTITPQVALPEIRALTTSEPDRLWFVSTEALTVLETSPTLTWRRALLQTEPDLGGPRTLDRGLDGVLRVGTGRGTFLERVDGGWRNDMARTAAFAALEVVSHCSLGPSVGWAAGADAGLVSLAEGRLPSPGYALACAPGPVSLTSNGTYLSSDGRTTQVFSARLSDGGWVTSVPQTGYPNNVVPLTRGFDGGFVTYGTDCSSGGLYPVCTLATGGGPEPLLTLGTPFEYRSMLGYAAESELVRLLYAHDFGGRSRSRGVLLSRSGTATEFTLPSIGTWFVSVGAIGRQGLILGDVGFRTTLFSVFEDGGVSSEETPFSGWRMACDGTSRECWVSDGVRLWRRAL